MIAKIFHKPKKITEIVVDKNYPFRAWLEELSKSYSKSAVLIGFWDLARYVLDNYPTEYKWIADPIERPPWVIDHKSLNVWYWGDMVKRINAYCFCMVSKLRELIFELESQIIANHLLISAAIMRSVFENCACLFHYSKIICEKIPNVLQDEPNLANGIVVNEDLEAELLKATHGSRFNWPAYFKGDFDTLVKETEKPREEHFQVNILKFIDEVTKKYKYYRLLYAMLCDYVHPNVGSNYAYVINEEVKPSKASHISLASKIPKAKAIEFFAPFSMGMWACCDIVTDALPRIENDVDPLRDWAKLNYVLYVAESRKVKKNSPEPKLPGE